MRRCCRLPRRYGPPAISRCAAAARWRACRRSSFDGAELSFAALAQQIDDTIAYIAAIPPQQFEGPADRVCRDRAGFADIELPADEYLNLYILPNFYFHFSMAYAIARSHGADIGKQDFDGYHLYAPGFSFERPAS